MNRQKPFQVSKLHVVEACRRIKVNAGAAGVDNQMQKDFERDLKGNLYKIWNRLSLGSWMPPPVHAVEIPKKDGSKRLLGMPTWKIGAGCNSSHQKTLLVIRLVS